MDINTPSVGAFSYLVSVEVWLPLPHAQMLAQTALHHYDARVRHEATAGAINALRNCALFAQEGDEPRAFHLTGADINVALKALEMARPEGANGPRLIRETRALLHDAFERVQARARELTAGAAAAAAALAEREALLRLVAEFPRRL